MQQLYLYRILTLMICLALLSVLTSAQTEKDRDAVNRAGLNYIEGFYEGDSSKLSASLSPSLKKFGFWKDEKSGKFSEANWMSYDEALKYVDNVREKKEFAKPGVPKKVEVIDLTDKIAAVKVSAWWGVDYMLLAKNDGKWMIEQVIWEGPSLESNATDQDRKDVKRASLNYLEGFYEGDSSKLSASLKPTLFKYGYGWNKEAGEYYSGRQMTFDQAVSYADGVKKRQEFPGPDAPREVEVLEVKNIIALTRVKAWWGVDYMLLAKNGDKWMIEQVLWAGVPD